MTSWVYFFSKFTPEALLFEALFIFILCGGYAAFWLLSKRKMGVITEAVPAGVVKTYLNELLIDAQQMRGQLFGLLSDGGTSTKTQASSGAGGLLASDPQVLKKLADLEARMAEQTKALERLFADRANIEKELAAAKAAGGAILAQTAPAPTAAAGSNSADTATIKNLQSKIDELEGKLAEYSVIEDDLANLKKLQQENANLKAQLGGGKTPAASSSSSAPSPAATSSPEPALVAAATAAATAAVVSAPAAAEASPQFENLVDQVEQSLKPAEPSATAATTAAVAAAPAPEPAVIAVEAAQPASGSTTPAAGGTMDTTDADLVAEFEKMLNG